MGRRSNIAVRKAALRVLDQNVDENGRLKHGAISAVAHNLNVPHSTVRDWWVTHQQKPKGNLNSALPDFYGPWSRHEADEVQVVINSTGTLKQAWDICQRKGLYQRKYAQFTRDVKKLPRDVLKYSLKGARESQRERTTLSYMSRQPASCSVYDHTKADVWVLDPDGNPIRPTVSFVVDRYSGYILAYAVSLTDISTEYVLALLAESFLTRDMTTEDGEIITVGGLPMELVFDHAAAHVSQTVVDMAARLSIVLSPIAFRASWQQGAAETKNSMLAQFSMMLPGSTGHGDSNTSQPKRYKTVGKGQTSPENLLTFDAFTMVFGQWVADVNRRALKKWAQCPTVPREVPEEELAMAMLKKGRQHTISDGEVRFRNRDYVGPGLRNLVHPNRRVTVYYLPTVTQWIEVEQAGKRLRLWNKADLPDSVRVAILQERKMVAASVNRIQSATRDADAVRAAALNAFSKRAPEDQPHYMDALAGVVAPTQEELEAADAAPCRAASVEDAIAASITPRAHINGKRLVPQIRSKKVNGSGRGKKGAGKAANSIDVFAALMEGESA